MIALYWDIGKRITGKQQQLGWGKAIVETLSKDLQNEFPWNTWIWHLKPMGNGSVFL